MSSSYTPVISEYKVGFLCWFVLGEIVITVDLEIFI